MKIKDIINVLEEIAPVSLQESYDNAGLLTGYADQDCTGAICCLDVTETVINEAIAKNCNLIVAHHPLIFSGLKKLSGNSYVERCVVSAVKHDIAIYAIHTNLDNVLTGVNGAMANLLGLQNTRVLQPKAAQLLKLYCYVPVNHAEKLLQALFAAGAGQIGEYSDCSFSVDGTGTFKPGENATPFSGNIGTLQHERETKIEVLLPIWKKSAVIKAMIANHPYEEVAYDVVQLQNTTNQYGSGLIGELPEPMEAGSFLTLLKKQFLLKLVKHTALVKPFIKKVALCGGSGSFLINSALQQQADIYITADIKYHDFFNADNQLIVADIGHFESEQFTIDWLFTILQQKFPNFALLKTEVNTNPVFYYT